MSVLMTTILLAGVAGIGGGWAAHWINTAFGNVDVTIRYLAGGATGLFTTAVYGGWTDTLNMFSLASQGALGLAGWAWVLTTIALIGVWGWNLVTTRRTMVQ